MGFIKELLKLAQSFINSFNIQVSKFSKFDCKWVIVMANHPRNAITETTVAIHSINNFNIFFGQFKVENVKVLRDARFGYRFGYNDYSTLNLKRRTLIVGSNLRQ